MDKFRDLPLPLQKIIEEYINIDLIQLSYDLYELLPINRIALCINENEYFKEFMRVYDFAFEGSFNGEDFEYNESRFANLLSRIYIDEFICILKSNAPVLLFMSNYKPLILKYLENHEI